MQKEGKWVKKNIIWLLFSTYLLGTWYKHCIHAGDERYIYWEDKDPYFPGLHLLRPLDCPGNGPNMGSLCHTILLKPFFHSNSHLSLNDLFSTLISCLSYLWVALQWPEIFWDLSKAQVEVFRCHSLKEDSCSCLFPWTSSFLKIFFSICTRYLKFFYLELLLEE